MRRTALVLMIGTAPAALAAQSSVQVSPFPAQPDQVRWLDPSTGSWEAQNSRRDPITLRVPAQAMSGPVAVTRVAGAATRGSARPALRPAMPIDGGECLHATSTSGATVRAVAVPSAAATRTLFVLEIEGDRLLTSREFRFDAPVALRTATVDGAATLTGIRADTPYDLVGIDHRFGRFASVRVDDGIVVPLREGDLRPLADDADYRDVVARATAARTRCLAPAH